MTTSTDVSLHDFAGITDVDKATWAYLDALDERELRTQLFPYVRFRMVVIKRATDREVEGEVFGGDGDGLDASRLPVDLLANRMKLLTTTFALADGTRVKWLEATPVQHRERAAMQRKLAGRCLVDAERHEQAANLIEEFNVSCLAEIKE